MCTVAGEHEDLADVLVGDVAAVAWKLQVLAQRWLGGRGHEVNIARGQRGRTILWPGCSGGDRRSSSGSLAKFTAKRRASSRVSRLVRGREQNDPVAERSLGSFAVFDV